MQIMTRARIMCISQDLLTISLLYPEYLDPCTNDPELPTVDEAKTAIMEKINSANDRWASGDPMGFMECVAQDILWMDDLGAPIPVIGKESLGKYLENFKGQIPPHQHELFNHEFQFYGEIVIVNYRYQGTFDGAPLEPWKITSVYRYIDGDWLSVHENWSQVKPEPPISGI